MQQSTTSSHRNRSYVVTGSGRHTRWVLTGQKDYYRPGWDVDDAEWRTVRSYRQP